MVCELTSFFRQRSTLDVVTWLKKWEKAPKAAY